MRALLIISNEDPSLDELLRDVASLVIAWLEGIKINVLINGEVPINENRMDHVGYRINMPIDIKRIIDSNRPSIIIEDSASKKRLIQRRNELEHVELPKAFLYVNRHQVMEKNFILSLKKIDDAQLMYEMVANV